jgi:hypothetical protein
LPCCEWNFDIKFCGRTKHLSRYEAYLEYVKHLTQQSGYKVDVEHLRIPSTRNIAIVGQKRTIDPSKPEDLAMIEKQQAECLQKAKYSKFAPRTAPPKSHVTKKAPSKFEKKPKFKGTLHPAHLAALAAQKQAEQEQTGGENQNTIMSETTESEMDVNDPEESNVAAEEQCECCAFEKP